MSELDDLRADNERLRDIIMRARNAIGASADTPVTDAGWETPDEQVLERIAEILDEADDGDGDTL